MKKTTSGDGIIIKAAAVFLAFSLVSLWGLHGRNTLRAELERELERNVRLGHEKASLETVNEMLKGEALCIGANPREAEEGGIHEER